jgi:uncharacterized protein YqiB (DUF1249 family)
MTTVYERNFRRFANILDIRNYEQIKSYTRLESSGYMPLSVEVIERGKGRILVAMAHWYSCNGDLLVDPEMILEVKDGTIEALSIQHAGMRAIPVYTEDRKSFWPRRQKEQNAFLTTWLQNIASQGYVAKQEEAHVDL